MRKSLQRRRLALCLLATWGASSASAEPDRLVVRASPVDADPFLAPVSRTVLDAETVRFVAPRAPAELLNRAPGVFVQAGSGREHLTAIRSPVLVGGAGAGSFLFLQDGVPLRAPGFANVNGLFHAAFPFAESVTVIRGPGDVAYGSGALHGAIDVATAAPGEVGGTAQVTYGSFDRGRVIAETGGETWRGGLSVLSDGGYRDDSGALEIKSRAAFALGPGVLRSAVHQLEQETAGFIIGDDAFRVEELRRSNPNPEAFRDVRHSLASYHLPVRFGAWQGEVVPFARWTDMEFLQFFLPGDAVEENEHTSLGMQSLLGRPIGRKTDLAIGFDIDMTKGSLREFQEAPTMFSFVQGLHYDYRVAALEAAPFAKLTHQATDQLRFEGGVRATVTRYDYDNRIPDGAPEVTGRFRRPADRTDTFVAVTGKLSALYDLSDQDTLYTSLARGARPPQTTELYRIQVNQNVEDIEPETLDSVELGWRRRLNDRGQVALTAFAMAKRNGFFRDADGFNVTNAKTNHFGLEGEVIASLTETLSLRVSGMWSDQRYAFDREVSGESETISDGDLVDTAPRTLGTAQLTWQPTDAWRFEAALTHVGRYATNAANTVFYDGHDLLDLRVQRRLVPGVELNGIVRNVTDERYSRRADFAFGNERFFPGEERAYEVALSAKF